MKRVKLGPYEKLEAYIGAVRRMERVIREGLSFAPGQKKTRKGFHLADHVCGAVAEYAFYKIMGEKWSPTLESVDHGDFGIIEVKSTYLPHGNLIIPSRYTKSAQDLIFVFGIVDTWHNYVDFIGWIEGKMAVKHCFWRSDMPMPCYLIPREYLNQF